MVDQAFFGNDDSVIRVVDLHKSFGDLEVLKGVSFAVQKSEVFSVIGASGSGKSTMLQCMNHLEVPTSGEVYVAGQGMGFRIDARGNKRPDSAHNINLLRRDIGMVFQQFNLWPHMTALQNIIEAPVHVKKMPKKEAIDLATSFLEKVNLLDKKDEYPARLSGGQQQRVAIARALTMQPKVMMFDEPTSSLDPELIGEVLEVMETLGKEGMTMIVVTHEMGFAREASDRVLFLNDGTIEEEGPPDKLLNHPDSERLQQFLSKVLM